MKNQHYFKTMTWTFCCFTAATLVALLVTGSIAKALTIGGAEILWETPLFFSHEKLWRRFAKHH